MDMRGGICRGCREAVYAGAAEYAVNAGAAEIAENAGAAEIAENAGGCREFRWRWMHDRIWIPGTPIVWLEPTIFFQ